VIKQVLILVGAAATTAGVVAAVTLPGEAQQRSAVQTATYLLEKSTPPVFDSSYTAGMRIIHVPQAGVPRSRAAAPSYREDAADEAAVDVTSAPQPHKRVSVPQPRRVLPPVETKRTVLNAPKVLHDGPSPVRPLPRWRDIEKFTELPKPVTAVPPVADPVATPIPSASAAVGDGTPPSAN
jgi:hypothetical protein